MESAVIDSTELDLAAADVGLVLVQAAATINHHPTPSSNAINHHQQPSNVQERFLVLVLLLSDEPFDECTEANGTFPRLLHIVDEYSSSVRNR